VAGDTRFVTLPKLQPGDRVAVISPSEGLPGLFPWVQDLGLQRLHDVFGLQPVEYPTTRQMNSSLQDRARDVTAAFADPANRAVFASIGGSDQLRLLRYLDPQVFLTDPKPFFGYSDNTHLHNHLWQLGIPSFYGGAIMTQLAMQVAMDELTVEYLRHALFGRGPVALRPAATFNDVGLDWAEPANLQRSREHEVNEGWFRDGSAAAAGVLWGGCVESLLLQCSSERYLPSAEQLQGSVLFLETAEDIPDPWVISYLLTGFGERGWLEVFQAVLVGRPKAWEFDKPQPAGRRAAYRAEQRDAVLAAVRHYNDRIPVVQNLDFGHTDPQIALPYGGQVEIDAGLTGAIRAHY
jgi:muramoyltetrapeptide carboxypeptidase LdcA involved in peptidoglycan recycling